MSFVASFREALGKSRVVAILRGLSPANAVPIGEALLSAGISIMEVPLNTPDAWESFATLCQGLKGRALVGAGTVLSAQDVGRISAKGGRFFLSPNMDPEVITVAQRLEVASIPGVATPTEAFAAIKAGAAALKLFPGQAFPPAIIKAWKTVLPGEVPLLLSGGVNAENIKAFADIGVTGFGIATALFAPGIDAEEVGQRAKKLVAALAAGGKSHAHDGR